MKKKSKIGRFYENEPKALDGERIIIKIKGRLYDVTNEEESSLIRVEPDIQRVKEIMKREGVNSYTEIHQHPYNKDFVLDVLGSIPSPVDFYGFLIDDDISMMIISQQDSETGEIGGHYIIKKSNLTKKSNFRRTDYTKEELMRKEEEILKSNHYLSKVAKDVQDYQKSIGSFNTTHPKNRQMAIEEITKKYHLRVKFIPEPEHKFREGTGFFKGGLEGKVGIFIAISGILASIFFLFSNLIGNVIGSLNQASSNWIGGVLFIIGIIGAFAYFKKFK